MEVCMTVETARDFFMWCSIINYGALLFWAGLYIFAHDFLKRFTDRIMGREFAYFDAVHSVGMSAYKLCVILFFVVPWIALSIIR
jgi:hypothetical protein